MTERWHNYVTSSLAGAGGRLAAAFEDWVYMRPVLDAIRRRFPAGSTILELGCGAGLHAALLSAWGYKVTASDNDAAVLDVARETFEELRQQVSLREIDVTALPPDLGRFDLVFSLGLIEHFDRDVTIDLLQHQSDVASVVMAVVPTEHTRHAATVTDERLYDRAGWLRIFDEAGLRVSDSFVFGDVPTMAAALARRAFPPPLYRALQKRFTYGMNLCVISEPSD